MKKPVRKSVITREQARAKGLTNYVPGTKCAKGHRAERNTKTGVLRVQARGHKRAASGYFQACNERRKAEAVKTKRGRKPKASVKALQASLAEAFPTTEAKPTQLRHRRAA
jgi:hypothetical protein